MQILSDARWAKFEAAIVAVKLRKARPRKDDRRTIKAIIWRLDNGAKWRSIPAELGDWHHAYLRLPPLGCQRRLGQDHGACRGRSQTEAGVRLYRRHRGPGAPEGGRRSADQTDTLSLRFSRRQGSNEQAIGRSRGGLTRSRWCPPAGTQRRRSHRHPLRQDGNVLCGRDRNSGDTRLV